MRDEERVPRRRRAIGTQPNDDAGRGTSPEEEAGNRGQPTAVVVIVGLQRQVLLQLERSHVAAVLLPLRAFIAKEVVEDVLAEGLGN